MRSVHLEHRIDMAVVANFIDFSVGIYSKFSRKSSSLEEVVPNTQAISRTSGQPFFLFLEVSNDQ